MLLTTLFTASLMTPVAPATARPVPRVSSASLAGDKGKLPWFEGTFEELVAEATRTKKVIFMDFWTDWCGWCKRLDRDTFSNDGVVAEMGDVLCFNIDAESEAGRPLAKRFAVRGFPALVWLNPDGTARDVISGYLPPDRFKVEAARIKSDKNTLGDFARRVQATPDDLDLRFKYAEKLKTLGDVKGHDDQLAAIRKADPEGRSLPLRRMRLDQMLQMMDQGFKQSGGAISSLDTKEIEAFLGEETHGSILFRGWATVQNIEKFKAQQHEQQQSPGLARIARARGRDAFRKAWPHCEKDALPSFGSALAFTFYEQVEELGEGDLAFAIEVARKASQAAPEDASILDTLALCLFESGDRAAAMATIRRAIELEPDNEDLKKRLLEFESSEG